MAHRFDVKKLFFQGKLLPRQPPDFLGKAVTVTVGKRSRCSNAVWGVRARRDYKEAGRRQPPRSTVPSNRSYANRSLWRPAIVDLNRTVATCRRGGDGECYRVEVVSFNDTNTCTIVQSRE